MANCPACNRKLHIYDYSQFCPGCNVNLVYYKSNERLLDESEKAEIEHAEFQPRIDRAKAAFFGSPPAIVRIVLTFLPIGALFLPLVSESGASLNIIKLYNIINETGFGGVFSGAFSGNSLYLSVVLLLVAVAMIVVNLLSIFAALGRHAFARNLILNSVQSASGLAALLTVAFSGTEYKISAGAILFVLLCLCLLIWNIFLHFRGIPVEYKQCLIGGLPKEEYYELISQGLSKEQIRRKMLVALADLQQQAEKKREEDKQKEEEERRKRA